MDKNLPELKAEAKRLGLKRYSRLKKADLINLLTRNSSPILDEEIPEIDSEILKPTKYKPRINEDEVKRKKEIRELEEMLGLRRRRIIPEIKVWTPKEEKIQRKIRKIKEINRRRLKIAETASALRGFTRQFRIEGIPRHAPREFMQIARRDILKLMRENRQTRVRMILNCEMTRKELFSESTQILNTFFHSETVENLEGTDESAVFDRSIQTIEERIQNFNQRGSNWRFERVLSLDVHFTDFQPLRGSTFLPLPSKISTKKAVINMKNNDDQCFKWSVVRALNPVNSPRASFKRIKRSIGKIGLEWTKIPGEIGSNCDI